jgi:hypothetical protein
MTFFRRVPAEVPRPAARLGRPSDIQIERLRAVDPTLRVSNLKQQIPLQRAEGLAELGDALRKAGAPEK